MDKKNEQVNRREFLETGMLGAALLGVEPFRGSTIRQKRVDSNTVYASSAGIVLDGVTEQTGQIQAIFDRYGSAGQGLRFVMDGNVMSDGLAVWSNTVIETLPGCVWMKKGFPCAGVPQFTNKHHVAGPNMPVDHDITVIGGYFDGNRRGNSANSPFWSYTPQTNQYGWQVPMFASYGVSRVRMHDITAYDPSCYVINFANANDTFVDGLVVSVNPDDPTLYEDTSGGNHDRMMGNNGIQCEGYVTNGYYRNLDIQVSDDAVAFNADDNESYTPGGVRVPWPHPPSMGGVGFDPCVVPGPISNIIVDGLFVRGLAAPNNHVRAVTFTSTAQTISNITIRCVKGTALRGIAFTPWSPDSKIRGIYKMVTLSDINLDCAIAPVSFAGTDGALTFPTVCIAGSNFEQLKISDCQFNFVPGSPPAPIVQYSGATINDLILSNIQCNGFQHMMQVEGAVDHLTLNGHSLRGGVASILLAKRGRISRLRAAASNTPMLVNNSGDLIPSRKTDGTEDA